MRVQVRTPPSRSLTSKLRSGIYTARARVRRGYRADSIPEARFSRSPHRGAMKTAVFVGTSVDGFLARRNGQLDFLAEAEGVPHGFEEFMASVDAYVMGRKTFEWVGRAIRREGADWPIEKPVFVLTHRPSRLRIPRGATCEPIQGTPAQVIARLDRRGFRSLYVDGGETIQQFLRSGRVDRLIVTRVPVLIGSGIPLFGPLPRDVRLHHVRTRVIGGRFVQTEYSVRRK
jgi:dihydrofolate reductase